MTTDTLTREQLSDRLIEITDGTQTGAILRCAFDRSNDQLPRFTSKAICTSDGYLQANFLDRHGVTRHSAFIGSKADLFDNIRQLAQFAELSPGETVGLTQVVKDWIAVDYSNGSY